MVEVLVEEETMSERGSFITEYIYCSKCFQKMKEALCHRDKFLCAEPIKHWNEDFDHLNIIGGKIGDSSPGGEVFTIAYHLFNKANAPCHNARIAVIPDAGNPAIITVFPSGNTDIFWCEMEEK
jgi:hypothetical protein